MAVNKSFDPILFKEIDYVTNMVSTTRMGKFLLKPFKSGFTAIFGKLIYPMTHKEAIRKAKLFYGEKMKVSLPSSIDLYLNRGKSNLSEINLAKFLMKNLQFDQHFLDVGAHVGYYTLLGARLVGKEGKVIAFEPSTKSYRILYDNTEDRHEIYVYKKALSNVDGETTFYEFPSKESEYDSFFLEQYESKPWFQPNMVDKVKVDTTTIDDLTLDGLFHPDIIKIDVEGAEPLVVQGGKRYLSEHSPFVVMEYVKPGRHTEGYQIAFEFMKGLGYQTFSIQSDGELTPLSDIEKRLNDLGLEADNIVLAKAGQA